MSQERPQNPTGNNERPDYQDHSWWEERERRREWRREHRHHHEPLHGLFWGLLLILVGVLFFINQEQGNSWDGLWQYLLIGLGGIFLIDGLAHSFYPTFHFNGLGRFVPGIILVLVGLAFLLNFSQWWPVILIGVGAALLISLLFRRR